MNASAAKSDNPLRVGVVGASGFARATINALADRTDMEVIAVADLKREYAESAASRFNARVYLDVRSMIVESPIDACLMSLPHDKYPEYVRLAADRGLHLLKEKPLGRSFDEAMSVLDAYKDSGRVFMIGTQTRFQPGFAAMKERMASIRSPFLVRSHFLFNSADDFGWRGQKTRAGFGCFGDAGYLSIDLLNWLLGPPMEVYAMQSTGGRPNPGHPYDTDDTGLCMLHYPGSLFGYVVCSWVTAPEVMDIVVHSPDGTLTATPEKFEMLDVTGQQVDEQSADPRTVTPRTMRAKLDAFVAAIRSGEKDYPCSARENLVNQAVIEAAYLSGRTGQPQSTARIFELRGRSMDEFLPATKPDEPQDSRRGKRKR